MQPYLGPNARGSGPLRESKSKKQVWAEKSEHVDYFYF